MSYIWLRVNNNRLIMDCHMRANNAYKFLLINLDINNIIHSEASTRTNMPIGQYCHFVDSLHIYNNELESVKKYLKLI
jgi:thymidylate synthase